MRRRQPNNSHDFNIPEKANRILNVILIVMILIILRVWHLAVVQYDIREAEFRKPQRKVVVEPARRATIRDRFNIPLAINKVQYQAAILYSEFRQIPSIVWVKDPVTGVKNKIYKRREYITALAKLLAQNLKLDADRLEDLIYSKAAFYYNIPFVIKEEISEEEYYRLKMLEKDWFGVHLQRLPKRTYPQGKVGADIIGYLGAINKQEYENIIHEIHLLQEYIQALEAGEEPPYPAEITSSSQARQRLKELQEHAYTINDYVGKTGIEGRFEEALRGFQGKKSYYSDARGNFLRELPGSRDPTPGTRLLLTISSELQEYSEKLLIQNERIREAHTSHLTTSPYPQKQPWIKGGAIVAMDPHNGEVLALATYPRFDPNDFIASGNPEISKVKNANISQWFETEQHIAQLWDQKRLLEREWYNKETKEYYQDGVALTWEKFLEFILPLQHPVALSFKKIDTLAKAIALQKTVESLLQISEQESLYGLFQVLYQGGDHLTYGKKLTANAKHSIEDKLQNHPAAKNLRAQLDNFLATISHNYDKVLVVDLCRLAVDANRFSDSLITVVGKERLSDYKNASNALFSVEPVIRKMAQSIYHEQYFKAWRKENEKEFLKLKRLEEKIALVRYPKPYLDYLDEEENKMFQQFWLEHRWNFLQFFLFEKAIQEPEDLLLKPFFTHFSLEKENLKNSEEKPEWDQHYKVLQQALKPLSEQQIPNYLDTMRGYQHLNRPLLGKYAHLRKQNGIQLEKHLAAAFYPLYGFGYGRSYAFRQAATQGSLFKLVTAYAALKQRHQELEDKKKTITIEKLNPLEMTDSTFYKGSDLYLGYHLDGTPIPQHYKGGRLIRSQKLAMGKMDIIRALEESSNPYFSLIAGDFLKNPEDLALAASQFSYGKKTGIELTAEVGGSLPKDLTTNRTGLYSMAIGQHSLVVTPLQACVMVSTIANGGTVLQPKIVRCKVGGTRNYENCQFDPRIKFPYQEGLSLVGVDFPLYSATLHEEQKSAVKSVPTTVKREIKIPKLVRSMILEGMHRVILRMKQTGLSNLSNFYRDYPEAIKDYLEIEPKLLGKTSTAEAIENIDLDIQYGRDTYTHVWFGGISFDPNTKQQEETFVFKDKHGVPELVVIVYLKFGRFGREAAPVAAQIIKKWREIKERHSLPEGQSVNL